MIGNCSTDFPLRETSGNMGNFRYQNQNITQYSSNLTGFGDQSLNPNLQYNSNAVKYNWNSALYDDVQRNQGLPYNSNATNYPIWNSMGNYAGNTGYNPMVYSQRNCNVSIPNVNPSKMHNQNPLAVNNNPAHNTKSTSGMRKDDTSVLWSNEQHSSRNPQNLSKKESRDNITCEMAMDMTRKTDEPVDYSTTKNICTTRIPEKCETDIVRGNEITQKDLQHNTKIEMQCSKTTQIT